MEIEAFVSLFADKADAIVGKHAKGLRLPKPVSLTVGGTGQTGAVAPAQLLVEMNQRPLAGRVWLLRRFGIFGADPHTPVGNGTFQAGAQVTSPAAGATIASVSAAPGVYNISWIVSLEGTTAAADANNFKLTVNGVTDIAVSQNGSAAGTVAPQVTVQATVLVGQTGAIAVKAIAAGTVGAVYGAQISVVPVTGTGTLPEVYADVYSGAPIAEIESASETLMLGNMTDVIVPGMPIPSIVDVSTHSVMVRSNELVYALIYNPPINQTFVINARVNSWKTEEIEALGV